MKPAFAIALCLSAGRPALGGAVSYVKATSQLELRERARYHPLNLLDADPASTWCEDVEGDGVGEGVEISFKRPQRIDRIVITPAAGTGRRVTAVRVSDGTRVAIVPVGTGPTAQVFGHVLAGTTFSITIDAVGEPARDGGVSEDATCLADALLYLRDKPFGGGAGPLRYDPHVDRLVGTWNGGALGAPEQALVFSLDGSWEWTFTPLLGGKQRRLSGEYRFRGNRLLMRTGEVGRWADVQLQVRRVSVDPDEMGAPLGDYDCLTINEALGPDVAGEYTNARF